MQNKKILRRAALTLSAALLLSCAGCAGDAASQGANSTVQEAASGVRVGSDNADSPDLSTLFTAKELDSGYPSAAHRITLADGASRAAAVGVQITGDTITITQPGTYLLTGTLTNGQILIDSAKEAEIQLVLENASVTCNGSAALYVRKAGAVYVTTAADSTNALTSTGEFVQIDDNKVDGAVFSKSDLVFNGQGALAVTCEQGHGIVGKDDVKLTGGTLTVQAAKKGISVKDHLWAANGTVTVNSGTAAIHAENSDNPELGCIYIGGGSFDLTTPKDGIHATASLEVTGGSILVHAGDDGLHAEGALSISGGEITVAESYEGIEGETVTISGGKISVTAQDDGINAAESADADADSFGMQRNGGSSKAAILIQGGVIEVNAQGDGVDSNGSLLVEGGTLYVSGPTNSGNGALDFEFSGTITGGVVVAVGAAGMAQNFGADSTQGSILWQCGSQTAGTVFTLTDAAGNVLASYAPAKSYQTVVVSAPGIRAGESYTLAAGETRETISMGDSLIYGGGSGFGMGGFGGGMRGQTQPGEQGSAAPQEGFGKGFGRGNGEMQPPRFGQETDGQSGATGQQPTLPEEGGFGQRPEGMQPPDTAFEADAPANRRGQKHMDGTQPGQTQPSQSEGTGASTEA